MKRTLLPSVVAFLIALSSAGAGEMPAPYPGSVLYSTGYTTIYCSKDSFEDVVAYFTRTLGPPSHRSTDKDSAYQFASFVYSREPRDDGSTTVRSVEVTQYRNVAKNTEPTMRNLWSYVQNGLLTRERYEEIQSRYEHLNDYLFPDHGDGSAIGRILAKYETYMTTGFWDPAERQALTDELDRIAGLPSTRDQAERERRRAERAKVNAQVNEAMQRVIGTLTTSEGVDFWIAYLRELEEEAQREPYRVKIEMDTTVIELPGDKG